MTAGTIDVISDVICPWCWIGKRNLSVALAALEQEGLVFALRFRPFRLNPDMPPEGRLRADYRRQKFGSDERARALDARVAAVGAAAGLDFRFDLIERTPDTLPAHRLIRMAEAAGTQDEVKEALFSAYFNEGRDISDLALLDSIGAAHGIENAAARLAGDEERAWVEAQDLGARQGGIDGVPSFLLDRHVLASGALPPEELASMLRRGVAALARA
ncbi:putative DsbA family dithiol-disulfide isomerase [Humitalea rosea]|uniref:Putative DsbA family dithiol-disulfide isomerase n=1 Tax=Humitalea rosea TaxID=990373 RepID=A0A2W7JY58_9PROT|nr:DsbA family oxidoreductase [Humitalea rosea]PZW40430.1 putative DsbA family dithiol-disulfide isomerase [Humitalea rosea]